MCILNSMTGAANAPNDGSDATCRVTTTHTPKKVGMLVAVFFTASMLSSCKDGKDGNDGVAGKLASIVTISSDCTWVIDGMDTGKPACPKSGDDKKLDIKIGDNGNWWVNGKDTEIPAYGTTGPEGPEGETGPMGPGIGSMITIGANGNWYINGYDTGVSSLGSQIEIGANGNWYIDGKDTEVSAVGNGNTTSFVITATDALGRKLPEYEDVGPLKKDKYVGLFYWTWHTNFASAPAYNVSEILAQHPEAIDDVNSPVWPKDANSYFWGEPLFGYYRDTDNWVLRKHAEMLADAGVDVVFFDCTNGNFTWKESYMELCKVWTQARADGVKTPQIAFMLAFGVTEESREAINEIYKDLYQPGIYQDLFFMWNGKPLIMAYPENMSEDIKNYFTFRPGQPVYNKGPARTNHWGWLEIYPQHLFANEQMTVGVAQNWSSELGLTAMNAPNAFGRSYTNKNGHSTAEGAVNYGYNFQEQWDRALAVNPKFIFITGWNEWLAGRFDLWQGVVNAFPDQFSQECSRDIEPMKGGHGDNYYYQMIANIRRFKGMAKPEEPSAEKTIVIDGSFDDWNGVTPEYATYKGSAIHRDSPGWKDSHYTNTTGRNDFVAAKVARDEQHLYFYIETAQAITPSSEHAWMCLLIDADRNRETGWEGYDFIVNRVNPSEEKAVVEKNTGGWNWEKLGDAEYKVSANKIELRMSRSLLQLTGSINIEFKWADNNIGDGDIMNFYLNGDVAPSGRFNYVYQE